MVVGLLGGPKYVDVDGVEVVGTCAHTVHRCLALRPPGTGH
jgi:hypothetical protein